MAQINTCLRLPFHGVFKTLGEFIMEGDIDEPTYEVKEVFDEVITFKIDEDCDENVVLITNTSNRYNHGGKK